MGNACFATTQVDLMKSIHYKWDLGLLNHRKKNILFKTLITFFFWCKKSSETKFGSKDENGWKLCPKTIEPHITIAGKDFVKGPR